MKRHTVLATVFAASTIIAGAAYAADQPAAAPQAGKTAQTLPPLNPAQKAAGKDVTKLSADGAEAFRDVHLARVAIYDADPDRAKALIGKAQASLTKAKTDEAAFTKAEADLKQPAQAKAGSPTAAPAKSDTKADAGATTGSEATKPVTWLPIDGQLTLGEDFVATPQKSAAVADANKALAKGDRQSATEKLKFAGIDVNFTMAVLPLDRTTSDVDQSAKLLDQGKYYEANALLKQAEDGVRFDVVDTSALPQKTAAQSGKDSHTDAGAASKPTAR